MGGDAIMEAIRVDDFDKTIDPGNYMWYPTSAEVNRLHRCAHPKRIVPQPALVTVLYLTSRG